MFVTVFNILFVLLLLLLYQHFKNYKDVYIFKMIIDSDNKSIIVNIINIKFKKLNNTLYLLSKNYYSWFR